MKAEIYFVVISKETKFAFSEPLIGLQALVVGALWRKNNKLIN